MRRDADYVRELLLEFEACKGWRIPNAHKINASPDDERRSYHIQLMCDQGLLLEINSGMCRMTSYGHDFLDATRNNDIWEKAKRSAYNAGGFTLNVLMEIAVEYVKARATTFLDA